LGDPIPTKEAVRMRYLLIVVGLLGLVFGILGMAVGLDEALPRGEFFLQVGAVFLAVGLATVDIVQAIEAKRP
jgi:membrane associated rhomboid family serine protease